MTRALLISLFVLAACDTGFRPVTLIEDMRLLGIRAEPSNLRPGESTRLTPLLLDPSRATPATILWLGCDADPFNQNRSPCTDAATLQDPSALTGGNGTASLPPGVTLIGFNDRAQYTVPAGLFDVLPPEDARRKSGTVGLVIGFAVAETVNPAAPMEELQALFDRVQRKEVKSIIALFRINVAEDLERNTNPAVDAITLGGERWPRGAKLLMREREPVTLDLEAPDAAFESFQLINSLGSETRTERILTSWFSTAGKFSEETTALREGVKTIFTSPGTSDRYPVPEKRIASIYTVFRDTRGGQSWNEWPFFVCEDGAPVPVVSSVDWPSTASDPVVLHGSELGSVVDLIVDGVALENGAFSPGTSTWRGFLPTGVALGVARGTVHRRDCTRVPLF